ncbi:MAG: hypothetical protein KGH77_04010 [Candidatus Micrarchaeota archaeon]|nr:hypothetical protein [Candidatus Micrarchaeota archaeon]MDE1864565.1 hypothetical protein [Candidatus Micrarchaeota archaeon]
MNTLQREPREIASEIAKIKDLKRVKTELGSKTPMLVHQIRRELGKMLDEKSAFKIEDKIEVCDQVIFEKTGTDKNDDFRIMG